MKSDELEVLADNYLESAKIPDEGRAFFQEALQYVNEKYIDEAECAIHCYAGVCESEAFKRGFIAACKLVLRNRPDKE